MTLAIVIVLPEPVTPSSAWKRSFRSSPPSQLGDRLGLIARGLEGSLELEVRARHGGAI